jgi:hypothetical protein
MSEKQILDGENDITGFKSALFLDPMQCDQDVNIQTLPEKLGSLNIGSEYVLSNKTTPKSSDTKLNEYKNFLTKDLLQHLDESPTKPKVNLASLRRTSELYMSGGEDEEIPKQQHSLFYHQRQGLSKNLEKGVEDEMNAKCQYYEMGNGCFNHQQSLSYNPYNPNIFIPSDIENNYNPLSPNYEKGQGRLKKLSPNENYSFIPKNFEAEGLKQNVGIFNPTNTLTRNIPSFFPKNIDQKGQCQSQGQVRTVPKADDNKSFMYGKTGWICSMCKNFNYESNIPLTFS